MMHFRVSLSAIRQCTLFGQLRACLHGSGGTTDSRGTPLNRDRKIVAFTSICTTLGGLGEVPKCYGTAAKYVNRQNGGQRACSSDWCDFSFSSSFSSVFPELYLTVVTFNDAISQPTPRDSLFWRALANKFEL